MNANPKAVLISDIHFTPATLELATKSLLAAQSKALELRIPLIICGDTLDTKAIIRAECANRLIEILSSKKDLEIYMLVGNHDLLNEKGSENALEFLMPYCNIVRRPVNLFALGYLVPYFNDSNKLQEFLNTVPKGSRLIMHQGVQTAHMGHYAQDKTSLPKAAFKDFRVISGHYHRRQDIKCGPAKKDAVGLFSYIGNPYTLNFGEANDPTKGFQVLYDNGLLEFVPINLRKHMVVEVDLTCPLRPLEGARIDDLVWVKGRGPRSLLSSLKKADIGLSLLGHSNFKLDLIPADDEIIENAPTSSNIPHQLLDNTIDLVSDSPEHKEYLKNLWKELLDANNCL